MDREQDLAGQDRVEAGKGLDRRQFIAAGAAAGASLLILGVRPELARATPTALDRLFPTPPFSFTYNGTASSTLLASWRKSTATSTLADGSLQTTTTWDSGSGFSVRWVAVQYDDYPTVKWTVYFDNTSRSTSSVLENVLALDLNVADAANGPSGSDWTIHTGNGSTAITEDFQPFDVSLSSRAHRLFASYAGRPTNITGVPSTSDTFIRNGWPYFNIEWGGRGMICAVGWPGQWAFEANRTAAQALTVQAGMCSNHSANSGDHITTSGSLYLTKIQLAAGETVRTPMIVTQPWTSGTWIDAQNQWRRWLLDYHLPRVNSGPPQPFLSAVQYNFYASADDQIHWLDTYAAQRQTASAGGSYDRWWMDAGWYTSAGETNWANVGTWTVDSTLYPRGISQVADHANALGMAMILWFEPERVIDGTWLQANHPSWLLGSGTNLLNFGNADAKAWAIRTFNDLLENEHVNDTPRGVTGFYREDFNMSPLSYWNAADPSGQFGITQIRHVTGHMEYWQSILDTNPTLQIDTCASGGRRMDVQTLQYAVPLLRSDSVSPAVTGQCQNYGIALWVPVQGNQFPGYEDPGDGYLVRSSMAPCWCFGLDVADPATNWDHLPRSVAEFMAIKSSYLGDYYPLTSYSTADNVWMAWQYNERNASAGFVQAFRRPSESGSGSATYDLNGLNRGSTYRLTTYADTNEHWVASEGFSGTQGANQWYYQARDKRSGAYSNCTYDSRTGPAWYISGTSSAYVAADNMHPDNTYDAVRKWVAPRAGRVRISGRVYKQETGGGNGVIARVLKNSTELWSRTIAYNDTTGYSPNGALNDVEVAAGDALYFIVENNGDWGWDGTMWNPRVTMLALPSWNAANGFGSTQGAKQWYYQARDKRAGTYSNLTYDGRYDTWYRSGTSSAYVAADNMHPDNSYDSVLKWVSPVTGTIQIAGRVYKQETGGGNGVIARVLKNSTELWSRTIAYNDTTGYTTDSALSSVAVSAGDAIYFIVENNGDWSYDGTMWNPTISVLTIPAWSASSGFSGTQGSGNWYYQARDKSSGAYSNLTYDGANGPAWYRSGLSSCYVASNSMHPDNSYDAVRKWVAPATGRVKITGRVYKQLTGGNGVIASVLRNGTTLWSKTVGASDTTGYSTDADLPNVAVTAGDAIYFVLANNGDWASDATYWDPTVTILIDDVPPTTVTTQTGASLEDNGLTVSLAPQRAATILYEEI